MSKIPDEIGEARRVALNKAFSEIKLYVLNLKKAPTQAPYTPQYNFHNSTIGSVQTGNNSVANVDIQIRNEQSKALFDALDLVSEALAKVGSFASGNKDEIVELVVDSKAELIKEKPNNTKLSSYLAAIGGAISTIAELKPAYDALKSAAGLIGINLP